MVCKITDLTEKIGWYISHPVIDFESGRLLVGLNTQITLKLIEVLHRRGVDALEVSPNPIEIGEVYKEDTIRANERIARESKRHISKTLTEITKNVRKARKVNDIRKAMTNSMLAQVEDTVAKVIELISHNPTPMLYLGIIDRTDPYLIHHEANVAYLSLCLAQRSKDVREMIKHPDKGLPRFTAPKQLCNIDDLVPLGMSAMLHDIGKVFMIDTLTKNKKYNKDNIKEWELIKQHPKMGHDILFGKNIDSHALLGIKYHHENYDGSGYPYGISGNKIHLYARIIRVADSFDAATSLRPGRGFPKTPKDICIEMLKQKYYDPIICANFVKLILNKS